MTVHKRNGKWVARVEMGDGERIQKQRTFATKREAEDWERHMLAARGTYSDMTINDFWDGIYLPHCRDKGLREDTVYRYAQNFDRLVRPQLGRRRLSAISPIAIQTSINSCATYGAKRNLYTTMRQLLRHAARLGMVASVATDGCELPEHRRKPIEVADADLFAAYLDMVRERRPDLLAAVCVSLMGARRSEVCGLQWSDVTFGDVVSVHIHASKTVVGGEVVVAGTKTEHSERVLVAPGWAADILRERRGAGWVCPITPDAYGRVWSRLVKESGLPYVTLKNLRHSVGTALVDAGAALTDVQNWLGHDLPTTTARFYVQRTDASILRAASVLDAVGPGKSHGPVSVDFAARESV